MSLWPKISRSSTWVRVRVVRVVKVVRVWVWVRAGLGLGLGVGEWGWGYGRVGVASDLWPTSSIWGTSSTGGVAIRLSHTTGPRTHSLICTCGLR